jgi:hypothetical protein
MTLSDPPKDKVSANCSTAFSFSVRVQASFFRFACSAYQLQVAEHMAQRSDNDAVYVCLHARLYNLTDFVYVMKSRICTRTDRPSPHICSWEHPGGDAIVREFHLRDASNTFESVLHSSHARRYVFSSVEPYIYIARSMMREFTILDLTHIIGGDGAPAFLLRTERSKDR